MLKIKAEVGLSPMDPLTVVVTISVIVTRIIVATIASIPLIIVTIIAIIAIALIPVVAVTLVPILIGTCVERGFCLVSSVYQSTNESHTALVYCCYAAQRRVL